MKILVTGGSGLVGSRFVELAAKKFNIVSPVAGIFDMTKREQVAPFLKEVKPQAIVNFAALTDVNAAEKERGDLSGAVWEVNALGAENLARVASQSGTFLVQISTDFVFEGSKENPGPYGETSPVCPKAHKLSWYGYCKAKGEEFVRLSGATHAIVRIAYPFRQHFPLKSDFARRILELYKSDSLYPLYTDQVITPCYLDDFCTYLATIIERGLEGVFHLVSQNATTPYDFAFYLLERSGVAHPKLSKSLLVDTNQAGDVLRPVFGGLSSKRTQERLGVSFKTWQEQVNVFLDII
ncbi:MAG: NAD(P)-dependent oxidoreductase [bacterium]